MHELAGPDDDSEERPDMSESDPNYEPVLPSTSGDVVLTLPAKKLFSGTAEIATRCNISHRATTALTANIVKMGGGDMSQCSISASTSHRQRKDKLLKTEAHIRKHFKEAMPNYVIIHWDSKSIKYVHQQEDDDRLAIVASIPRDNHKHQFLAAPRIPDSTGISMTNAVLNTIALWEIPSESIVGMSWDTTTSNTGRNLGSSTLFEKEIGRGILWLACRHHIGELHVKHADTRVRGDWNGRRCHRPIFTL